MFPEAEGFDPLSQQAWDKDIQWWRHELGKVNLGRHCDCFLGGGENKQKQNNKQTEKNPLPKYFLYYDPIILEVNVLGSNSLIQLE